MGRISGSAPACLKKEYRLMGNGELFCWLIKKNRKAEDKEV